MALVLWWCFSSPRCSSKLLHHRQILLGLFIVSFIHSSISIAPFKVHYPREHTSNEQRTRGGGITLCYRFCLHPSIIRLDMGIRPRLLLLKRSVSPFHHRMVRQLSFPSTALDLSPITSQFFEELSSVLERIVTRNSQLVVIGDFNIHLEDTTDISYCHHCQKVL